MLQREPNVIVAEVDGKPMLLNLGTWVYLSLNETGRRIWEHLAEPRRRTELLALLLAEFDGAEEAIEADLERFLRDLRAQGFIAGGQ